MFQQRQSTRRRRSPFRLRSAGTQLMTSQQQRVKSCLARISPTFCKSKRDSKVGRRQTARKQTQRSCRKAAGRKATFVGGQRTPFTRKANPFSDSPPSANCNRRTVNCDSLFLSFIAVCLSHSIIIIVREDSERCFLGF